MKKTSKILDKNIDNYVALVKILGKTYKSEGATISEAISGLNPLNCKGRSILTVQKDGISKDRVLMPTITYRLFNTHGLSRDIAVKNASLLFQGL